MVFVGENHLKWMTTRGSPILGSPHLASLELQDPGDPGDPGDRGNARNQSRVLWKKFSDCRHCWVSSWWFPKMGVPPVIIHFNGTFQYKPCILFGYTHLWKPPFPGWCSVFSLELRASSPRLGKTLSPQNSLGILRKLSEVVQCPRSPQNRPGCFSLLRKL